jgi:hypothetical protein
MFSNAYNRKIAEEVYKLNKKFIEHQQKVGRAMTGGAQYMVGSGMEGGNWVDDMTSGISQGMNAILGPIGAVAQHVAPLLPLLGVGRRRKAGRPRKGKGVTGGAETGGAEVGSGSTGGKRKAGRPRKVAKGVTGGAETGGKRKAGRPRKVAKGMEGEGIFSSLLSKIGLGEGEEMLNEVEGGKRKRKAGRPRKGKGVTGGAETGGAKKKPVSKWIEHVKAFAKKHKMKYNEALKDPRCKASYYK